MKTQSNTISIFRKRVVANIPGFSNPQAADQNEWLKLADYKCVDFCPGQTARVYESEHASDYKNQDDLSYYEFNFESVRQDFQPPYDIKLGDYIGFKQGTSVFFYRIVKCSITGVFQNCCVVQIVVNITQPREAQYLLECGPLQPLEETDIIGGIVAEEQNGIITQGDN